MCGAICFRLAGEPKSSPLRFLCSGEEGGREMPAKVTYRSQLNPAEMVVLASSFALVALIVVLAWH
jgi:hypothetical protein